MADFKNIIFDFGGVLIDIDYQRCVRSFQKLGFDDFDNWYSQLVQNDLFDDLETGRISPDEFREKIRQASKFRLTDAVIDAAWNSILTGLPPENILLLSRLRPHYRLFLLSNTNAIHETAFTAMIAEEYGRNILPELFERIYFSHHIGMRKPHPEIFLHVLKENNLTAAETLFIDDSPQHIEGAKKTGLQTLFLEKGKKITEMF